MGCSIYDTDLDRNAANYAALSPVSFVVLRDEHGRAIFVVAVSDSEYTGPGEIPGAHGYAALLAAHDPQPALVGASDEWDANAVSYSSGTTGDPQGRGHPPPRRLPQRGVQRGHLDDAAALRALPAGCKVPRRIRFGPIPKTRAGKIQKFQLRQRVQSSSAIE